MPGIHRGHPSFPKATDVTTAREFLSFQNEAPVLLLADTGAVTKVPVVVLFPTAHERCLQAN